MLLRVKRDGAAGGWGGAAGGGAHPVAQLDPGVHICPQLPILEPLETALATFHIGQSPGLQPWVEPCLGFSSLLPHYWLLLSLEA